MFLCVSLALLLRLRQMSKGLGSDLGVPQELVAAMDTAAASFLLQGAAHQFPTMTFPPSFLMGILSGGGGTEFSSSQSPLS